MPTTLEPALAVAASLPWPETVTDSFTPARLDAERTLTFSEGLVVLAGVFGVFGAVRGCGTAAEL